MSVGHRAIICVEACRVSWKFNSMCQHPEPLLLLHNSFLFIPMHSCTVWYVLDVNVVIVAPGVIYRVIEWKKNYLECIGLRGWKDWNFKAEAGESGEPLNSPISRLRLISGVGFNQPTNPPCWSASCCLGWCTSTDLVQGHSKWINVGWLLQWASSQLLRCHAVVAT